MDKIAVLFQLHTMLREMEKDVGLDDLTSAEKSVFFAAHSITNNIGEAITSDQIRHHALVADLAQATYHRALRSLLELGLLEKAKGRKARHYVVRLDRIGQ